VPDSITETRSWSREAYDRAVATGVLGPDDRVELIEGRLVSVTPQGSRHATAIRLANRALGRAFGGDCIVQCQLPLAIAGDSEPEPDVAVVAGEIGDYRDVHPSTALLVVEVADDSLVQDRTVKQRLYARCSVPEYWIVAIPDARLEVLRDPAADGYRDVTVLQAGDTVAPLARPGSPIPVADLLP